VSTGFSFPGDEGAWHVKLTTHVI